MCWRVHQAGGNEDAMKNTTENTENTTTATVTEREALLNVGVEYLDARLFDRVTRDLVYWSDVTRSEWIVPEDDVVELGRLLSAPGADSTRVYTAWTTDSEHEELMDEEG